MNNANKKLSEEEKAKRRLLLQDLAQWREETGSNSLVRYAQEKGVSHPYLSLVAKWERSSQRNHRNSTKEVAPFTKMGRQPMERSMFIFCGSSNKVVKMLVWDHNGFWLATKRIVGRGGFTAMGKGAIGKDSLPFIKRIGKLYSIERELRAKWDRGGYADEQAFVDERVALTGEVLAGIHALAWEKAGRAVEGTEFSKAVNYVLNQWPRLVAYPHYFFATPDNNAAERHTRPLSVGARGWLFANTAAGAESSALIYTLTENAKLSGVNPHEYLWALLEQAPSCRDEADWEQLLPWKIDLGEIRAKKSLISSARPIEGRTEDYTIRGGLY